MRVVFSKLLKKTGPTTNDAYILVQRWGWINSFDRSYIRNIYAMYTQYICIIQYVTW